MAPRVPVLTTRYRASLERLGIRGGTPAARDIAATIRALISDDDLPGVGDEAVPVPPTGSAFVRRVVGRNLWLYFTFTTEKVFLGAIVDAPPVPRL